MAIPMHRHSALGSYVIKHRLNTIRQASPNQLLACVDEESLRRFIHDLKLPLTLLKGELEAIQDGIHHWSPSKTAALLSEVNQINQMLENLRDDTPYSVAKSGDQQHMNLSVSLAAAIERHQSCLKQYDIKLISSIEENIIVTCAGSQTYRIFNNLLSNSLKYTAAPGVIAVSLTTQQQFIRLSWLDSSPAPAVEELSQLGQSHFRACSTSDEQSGSGLGLASVCHIVTQLNGSANFSLSPLGGLAVEILLPCLER